jgi:hypothetical protein
MIHRVEIAGIFLILGIINYFYVIYDKLAKRKFMTLCSLFVEKFGQDQQKFNLSGWGILFSFMRDAFFIKALYFKENSFHTRGMDNEQIRFIKELPNQYTDWLRVKVRLSIVGIYFIFMMLSVFYLPSLI